MSKRILFFILLLWLTMAIYPVHAQQKSCEQLMDFVTMEGKEQSDNK